MMSIQEFLIKLTGGLADLYMLFIVIRSVMTWFRYEIIYKFKGFFDFIVAAVDPFLGFIRRILPVTIGMLDLSPILALILVSLAKQGMIWLIVRFLA
jgi:YggT family protein